MYRVTKTYGHDLGLTSTFRQPKAQSHCRFIHGYALSFKLTFECADGERCENGWVINFGGLKPLKEWLCHMFDHTTLIAQDDPALHLFEDLNVDKMHGKLIDLRIVPAVGCEAFARLVYERVSFMLQNRELGDTRARIVEVEVREHGANSAIYRAPEVVDIGLRLAAQGHIPVGALSDAG